MIRIVPNKRKSIKAIVRMIRPEQYFKGPLTSSMTSTPLYLLLHTFFMSVTQNALILGLSLTINFISQPNPWNSLNMNVIRRINSSHSQMVLIMTDKEIVFFYWCLFSQVNSEQNRRSNWLTGANDSAKQHLLNVRVFVKNRQERSSTSK